MALRAKDFMNPAVLTVDAGADALSCARLMVDHRQGYAVVTGGESPISGIVTEWDLLEKVLGAGRAPSEVRVAEIATSPVVACDVDAPMDELVARMVEHGIRRLVVTKGEHVVGVITSKSILGMFRKYVDQISADIACYQSSEPGVGL
ncbi:MAG: CBS domain-containing protein [Thermoplasmata archaeon]